MQNLSSHIEHQKAAIYIRVSTQWQVDKDSLQVQRRELLAYADMILGIQDCVVFEDPGFSAKNTDRPEYQHMMSRLRTGEFTHLLVWKIDRISRNLLDFSEMYVELKSLGITFISKNEQFDTSSAIGEAMLKIIMVFAELERNMTSERVTAVMLSRANNGQWNGGKIPYGYIWDKTNKQFQINEPEAKIIHNIFDKYEEQQSVLAVTREFNSMKLSTRNGNQWSTASLYKILTNAFYIGTYIYNTHDEKQSTFKPKDEDEWITIKDHHPPIIMEDQFERVQYILKRNYKTSNRHTKRIYHNCHIFGGLMKCGVCGSNMVASADRRRANGWRPSQYGCSQRRKDRSCANKYITDNKLGPFIFNFVKNILLLQNHLQPSDTPRNIGKKLLDGECFKYYSMYPESAELIYSVLSSDTGFMEYRPSISKSEDSLYDSLLLQKTKLENALSRLQNIYLYSEEAISEKDYIIEKQKITASLSTIEEQIAAIPQRTKFTESENQIFTAKASYLLLLDTFSEPGYIDYADFITNVDPIIPRNFISSIIDSIFVKDGHIQKIIFHNGITQEFAYHKKQT